MERMTPSIWQLLIVLVIVLLLFGRGKIPQLMGDMAKGIKSFKKGGKLTAATIETGAVVDGEAAGVNVAVAAATGAIDTVVTAALYAAVVDFIFEILLTIFMRLVLFRP